MPLSKMICWKCKHKKTCKIYKLIDEKPMYIPLLENMIKLHGIEITLSIMKCRKFEENNGDD